MHTTCKAMQSHFKFLIVSREKRMYIVSLVEKVGTKISKFNSRWRLAKTFFSWILFLFVLYECVFRLYISFCCNLFLKGLKIWLQSSIMYFAYANIECLILSCKIFIILCKFTPNFVCNYTDFKLYQKCHQSCSCLF